MLASPNKRCEEADFCALSLEDETQFMHGRAKMGSSYETLHQIQFLTETEVTIWKREQEDKMALLFETAVRASGGESIEQSLAMGRRTILSATQKRIPPN